MDITLHYKLARKFLILCLTRDIKAFYTKVSHKHSLLHGELYVTIRVEVELPLQIFELGAYWHGVIQGIYKLPQVSKLEPFDSFVKYQKTKYELYPEFTSKP